MNYPIEYIDNNFSVLLLCCADDIQNGSLQIGDNDVRYYKDVDNVTLIDLNINTLNILKKKFK